MIIFKNTGEKERRTAMTDGGLAEIE